jgi:ATP-binding cassette subfamily B protein
MNAHQILVINNGEIVERGTHDEMMKARGFYYNLYMSQFKGRVADILPGAQAPSTGGDPL